jgi:hypothetical protein
VTLVLPLVLAVGAGDTDECQLARGVAVEVTRQRRQRPPAVGHHHRGASAQVDARGKLLDHHGLRAEVEGVLEVGVAVDVRAAQGEEEVAGSHRARVVAEPSDHRILVGKVRHEIGGQRREEGGESHQMGPAPGSNRT